MQPSDTNDDMTVHQMAADNSQAGHVAKASKPMLVNFLYDLESDPESDEDHWFTTKGSPSFNCSCSAFLLWV